MDVTRREFSLTPRTLAKDLLAGAIVSLVALPLCLGIAIASGVEPIAGLIAGVVGGIVVGVLSGSHTSVSGPAAGLTGIVLVLVASLPSYETFLLTLVLAGAFQVVFGLLRAGALSAFFPNSVIKGLLAAIGLILIFKQLPLLLGYWELQGTAFAISAPTTETALRDDDPLQPQHRTGELFIDLYRSLAEILGYGGGLQLGAITVGLFSLLFLIIWEKIPRLKTSIVPSPLVVVLAASMLAWLLSSLGGAWALSRYQLVNVPDAGGIENLRMLIQTPDFSQLNNAQVYIGAMTIALVASLETLLNLGAVDKLDKKQRVSPPNRELVAQGVGNMTAGMLGGIPVTSVVIRGSVNILAGAETKLSCIWHGFVLLGCVIFIPHLLQLIPMSCLAAILLLTGYKLASPALFRQMASDGRHQFLPFAVTVLAIVMTTDLLVGIFIGLAISLIFILHSSSRLPIRRVYEKHIDGDFVHIELANQVSFLNRVALRSALLDVPSGGRILLDARRTDYIDPDVLDLIRDFRLKTAPARGINVQLVGFDRGFSAADAVVSLSHRIEEYRDRLTPAEVITMLRAGNQRFMEMRPLDRLITSKPMTKDSHRQAIAVILTGIDSMTPVELIFDLGIGDAYVLRTVGAVIGPRALSGIEYGVAVGQAKLVVVMGHGECELLSLAVQKKCSQIRPTDANEGGLLEDVLDQLADCISLPEARQFPSLSLAAQQTYLRDVAQRHVQRTVAQVLAGSPAISNLVKREKIMVVGALYDDITGEVQFLPADLLAIPHDSRGAEQGGAN